MKTMKRIHGKARWVYVAGPYRASSVHATAHNISVAKKAAVKICAAGMFPVTPHLNTAEFDYEDSLQSVPPEFWLDQYKDLLLTCDCVVLVGDYSKSEGTKAEIAVAQKCGIPVYFTLNELFDSID